MWALHDTFFFKRKKILIFFGIIFSGLCWYLSCGLTGSYWFLLWAAPLPILFISYNVNKWQAFFIAFLAYLIGRLSWFSYLISVIPLLVVVIFTIIMPLIFALVILLTRRIVLISSHWSSAFAFPVLWVCFEYMVFLFSRDGTMGSLAYTQSNFLPIVQIASITGIQGITFLVTFIPSALSVAFFFKQQGKRIRSLVIISAALFTLVLLFGIIRLTANYKGKELKVALTVIDEKSYHDVYDPVSVNEIQIAALYTKEISDLATQNIQVVILPEKAIIVTDSTDSVIGQMFKEIAKKYHVMIIVGVTKLKNNFAENNAWVISSNGKLTADYQKVNLFEGEAAEGFRPGQKIGLFNHEGEIEGVAICKDLDFQKFMLAYGREKILVLYAPAWDFVKDGWLHSRMAILRGVEGGYSIARNAREGKLTISDYCGNILFEASSEHKNHTVLIGKLPLDTGKTIYSRTGDWFSYINMMAALYFIFFMGAKSRVRTF